MEKAFELSMRLAEFTTIEEKNLWRSMKDELHKHSRYTVRKQYYPFMMDLWETKRAAIEEEYRSKILELQKNLKQKRIQKEEELRKKREEEELRKKREEEDKQKAAEALLLLSKSGSKKRCIATPQKVRRSKRIAMKNDPSEPNYGRGLSWKTQK